MNLNSTATMEQAKKYLDRFRQAVTVQQQRLVAEEYQAFYTALSTHEQTQADEVMQVLWPEIDKEVAELERLTQYAQQRLKGELIG